MIRTDHHSEVNRLKKHQRIDTGLSREQSEGVVAILNRLLADETVLYAKARDFHWNVAGPHFHDLHVFFQSQYEELAVIGDDVAERARAMGGRAMGTLQEALEHTQLKEENDHELTADAMIAGLLEDHEAIIQRLRTDLETCAEKFHDMGTNNFLTDLMEQHEKMAWMLRACLEDRS